MKNKYISSLLFLTFISCFAMSCKDEVRYVNEIEKQPKVTDQTPKDNTILAIIDNSDKQGKSETYQWVKGDAIAVFNVGFGKKYKFNANESGDAVDFTSQSVINKGDMIIAYYPYKEDTKLSSFNSIHISNRYVQETPEIKNKGLDGEYMFAHAIVGENNAAKLIFKPLTSIFEINITNKSSDANFIIDSLLLEVSEPVFPESVTIDDNGSISSFSEKRYSYINIDFKGQTLSENKSIKSVIRLLPTSNGEKTIIKGNEIANLILKAKFETGETKDFVIYKGEISNMPLLGFSDSRNNFLSSEKYSISYDITYQEIPAQGYRIDDRDGKKYATVFSPSGLKALAEEINKKQDDETLKSCVISIYNKLTNKTFDMSGIDWNPIKEFKGLFDANGLVLENLKIKKDGTNAAFITKSHATISNLVIKNANVENADNVAVFANEVLGGVISNCVVERSTVSGNTGFVAGFAGKVSGETVIKDCHISNTTITAESGAGGFISDVLGNAEIKGCYSDETVVINVNNISKSAGGLVNVYSGNKPLVACYSTAVINIKRGAGHIGGLIGQLTANGKDITGCYAAGTINLEGAVNGCSVGGFLGTRWINKEWNLYKGVYSNTVINPGNGNIVGNVQGKAQGPKDGIQKGLSVYYLQNNNLPAVGEKSVTSTQKISEQDLKGKLSEMNGYLNDSGYIFTVEGSTSKEPLKIKKVGNR